jgi:RNA polymerase sigma-70 factor (ECF subfamily)
MPQQLHDPPDPLTRAAAGDMEAFAQFYDDNAESLLLYFQARTACPDTAADLTAETFAAVLDSLARYRPEAGSGRAWLFGIAHHQLTRYLRWRRIDSQARQRLGMATEILLDEESYRRIEELVDFDRMRHALDEGLSGLSPRLAAAVRLRVGEELPFSEVATRLGCTEAAARARVSRALRQLAADVEVAQ